MASQTWPLLLSAGPLTSGTEDLEFDLNLRCFKTLSLRGHLPGRIDLYDVMLIGCQRFLAFAIVTVFLFMAVEESAAQAPTLIALDQAIDLALAHNHALKAMRTLIFQNQAQEIT